MTLKEQKLRLNHIANPNKKRKYEECKENVKTDHPLEAQVTLPVTTQAEQPHTQLAEPNNINNPDKTSNPANSITLVQEPSSNEIQSLRLQLEQMKAEKEKQAEEIKRKQMEYLNNLVEALQSENKALRNQLKTYELLY